MHTVTTAVGALATVGALVSGCDGSVGIGGKPAVGKAALQTDIANRLAKAGEKPQSVTCKDDLIGEVGKTARCEVVISPTNSFEPVITVTGVDGSTIKIRDESAPFPKNNWRRRSRGWSPRCPSNT